MNRVCITGNITKDIELAYSQGGTAYCTINVAVNRKYTPKDGERQTDFFPVKLFGKLAETVANHLGKGRKVGVEGRLEIRSYEKDGIKHYITEIIADSIDFLDKPKQQEDWSDVGQEVEI